MSPTYGVVIAVVTDVADPDGQDRVRLRYPWLADDGADGGWAPIAVPLAGRNRGYHYLPEVDDEALVAFEHGSIDHPFVLGFLHNGVDTPPSQGINEHVRRVRSVAGHVLEFDDRPGQESVRLSTNSGHRLELRDPEGSVEILTSGGQKIRLTDNPAQIELATVGGTTVKLENTQVELSGPSVTVQGAASVQVTAPAVQVTTAALTVTSPLATFAGAVQCTTLIASAGVSSPVYTPGAGNIW